MDKPIKILFIPDCQVKPGIDLSYLTWAGKAICEYRPDVIVNAGDFADMPSLSSYDKAGSRYFEGKRYKADIDAAKEGMKLLLQPLKDLQAKQKKNKEKVYKPRKVFLYGNHCNRIDRAINANPILEGTISKEELEFNKDWEVYEFLKPVFIAGFGFCHYWPVGLMQRPAASPQAIINKLHMSCIAGHQQGKQIAYSRRADGKSVMSIICGSYYSHNEDYMPDNNYWRGLVMLNEAIDGTADEMFLSIRYLKERFGD